MPTLPELMILYQRDLLHHSPIRPFQLQTIVFLSLSFHCRHRMHWMELLSSLHRDPMAPLSECHYHYHLRQQIHQHPHRHLRRQTHRHPHQQRLRLLKPNTFAPRMNLVLLPFVPMDHLRVVIVLRRIITMDVTREGKNVGGIPRAHLRILLQVLHLFQ